MLVAVIMVFVVFSFTGVAVLNISYLSSSTSMETVNNIKLQYTVESSINKALWKINSGVDSLVNFSSDGVTAIWDSTTQVLSVNVDRFQMESEILLDLSEDTHFDRGIAAEESIDLDGNNDGLSDEHRARGGFGFLPQVDMDYFNDNAVEIHTDNWKTFDAADLTTEGIHIFTGNFIAIEDITLNNSTLVFTGFMVFFKGDNYITAPPADSTGALPALVFTHPWQSFDLYSPAGNETILGAIYCKQTIFLRNGTVSGPIVGRIVSMSNNFDFLDTENNDYYQWTHGFGERSHYDWPKQIGRWRINKWAKKSIQS
ncbi:MAG: hypothetical protein U9Q77_08105 [Candidatus Marinimicrobia bacterium]|nr:hypothetical protein [Candidatus Neomarinimicrobiota bacterium]